MGRTARVRITSETLARLQAGEVVTVRLQPNTSELKLSLLTGDESFEFDWKQFDKVFEEFGKLFKSFHLPLTCRHQFVAIAPGVERCTLCPKKRYK